MIAYKSKQRRPKCVGRGGNLFLGIALFVIFSLSFSSPVSAREGGNHLQRGQDGTDPYTTVCAGEGTSYGVAAMAYWRYAGYQFGDVQLWTSKTCKTFWTRYVCLLQPEKCPEVSYRLESLLPTKGWITTLDVRRDTGGRTFQFFGENPVMASASIYGNPGLWASTSWISPY